jgi:hypothetical protein
MDSKCRPLKSFPIRIWDFLIWRHSLGRTEYHANLIHLGKSNLTSSHEWKMIPRNKRFTMRKENIGAYPPSANPVYLYETAQLSDMNETRIAQVLLDLQRFLGMSQPLLDPPLHYSPGKKQSDQEKQRLIDSKKVDICEERYEQIRNKLIKIGAMAQEWILMHFLQSPDVYVSNPDHFREILEGYKRDPCLERRNLTTKT